MDDDISHLLKTWKYRPNDINVRIIVGRDGGKKLQMRIDLGVLQMELDGRPDGRRPHRFDSYLSYFERRAKTLQEKPFFLTPLDCLRLQQEAMQYYHRYIALMRLGDYTRVARDTRRNLKVFSFVHKYNRDRDIIWAFEQYRPYVLMMHVRAVASLAISENNTDAAVRLIESGITSITRYYQRYRKLLGKEMIEVDLLREWLGEVRLKQPLSEREKLQMAMAAAVEQEAYETAAQIRDQLSKLL
jgi:hypothetical protein